MGTAVGTQERPMMRQGNGSETNIAPETFKSVAGSFLTGVAVVSARSGSNDYGCTVSSVASLSLEPPLLLICLTAGSATLEAIRSDGQFALAILDDSEDSQFAAMKFAKPGDHPFADIEVERVGGGLAVPASWIACARLELWDIYPGGDHEIVVGRVIDGEACDREPLGYWRSGFVSKGNEDD